jgi:uncharacterized membrane protein HdeD (DUF308 family)
MALLDWIFVLFGAAVALAGGWIQLYPERVIPGCAASAHGEHGRSESRQNQSSQIHDWQLDPGPRAQIRMLGACFLFMGTFFAFLLTTDLMRQPWWTGALGGLVAAIATVVLVYRRVGRQQRRGRHAIQQSPLAEKALELH